MYCESNLDGFQLLGYCELCENKRVVVSSFLKSKDKFVCLPTGSGKSLCYCLLLYAFNTLRGWRTEQCGTSVVKSCRPTWVTQ